MKDTNYYETNSKKQIPNSNHVLEFGIWSLLFESLFFNDLASMQKIKIILDNYPIYAVG